VSGEERHMETDDVFGDVEDTYGDLSRAELLALLSEERREKERWYGLCLSEGREAKRAREGMREERREKERVVDDVQVLRLRLAKYRGVIAALGRPELLDQEDGVGER